MSALRKTIDSGEYDMKIVSRERHPMISGVWRLKLSCGHGETVLDDIPLPWPDKWPCWFCAYWDRELRSRGLPRTQAALEQLQQQQKAATTEYRRQIQEATMRRLLRCADAGSTSTTSTNTVRTVSSGRAKAATKAHQDSSASRKHTKSTSGRSRQ